jgi:DNA-binding transcriptional LysR family regulator
MKLEQLRRMALFAMVAKEGSFTTVSKQQNITTAAISSAISKLEKDIGARLLHRTTRTVRPTDVGFVFLRHCEAMLLEAETAHEQLHHANNELSGTITIAAAHWEADTWLIPALKPLLYQNPNLVPHLVVSDQQVDIVKEGIDIAIRSGGLKDSALVARALTNHLYNVIVAAPDYLKHHGVPLSAEDLNEHYIVAFTSFTQPQTIQLTHPDGTTYRKLLQLGAKTDTLYTAKQLCMMNFGLARLPFYFVHPEIDSGQLQWILPNYKLPSYKTYAVTAKRTLQSAKTVAVIDALQNYFQSNYPR